MQEVIIIVPVYKEQLSRLEQVSLAQLVRVLGAYPIVFVAPRSLVFDYYRVVPGAQVVREADEYFVDTASYSRLMLTAEFYEQFAKYSYMLIYQLDAFVFSDRLLEFCRRDYDYIGAPVPRYLWRGVGGRVGNGGFSLRKITSIIRVLRQKKKIVADAGSGELLTVEDVFFAYVAARPEYDFHVPSSRAALEFAIDYDIYGAYRRMPGWLPFGCHGINYSPQLYLPLINSYGYTLTAADFPPADNLELPTVGRYLLQKLASGCSEWRRKRIVAVLSKTIGERFAIYGAGRLGRHLLALAGEIIVRIYDRSARELDGRPIVLPTTDALRAERLPIVITPAIHEDEIAKQLDLLGFREGREYYRLSGLYSVIIREYRRLYSSI